MKPFYLSDITTEDGLMHQGIFSFPKKRGKRAILWMHGLSATFYNDIKLYETVAEACEKKGWAFAIFNNRGHDLLAGIRKYDGTPPNGYTYYPGGAGQEVFEESVLDIEAGIEFLLKNGFSEIVIVGHSTGANKTCYFVATQKNPHVIGVVLSGPMSDRLNPKPKRPWYTVWVLHFFNAIGRGDSLLIGQSFFPGTPKRFLSLLKPGSLEDVFDYGDEKPKLTFFSKIRLPLMVLLAGKDEYADRPMSAIKKVFDSHAVSDTYKSIIIPDAVHKFHGKEKEVADTIVSWIASI